MKVCSASTTTFAVLLMLAANTMAAFAQQPPPSPTPPPGRSRISGGGHSLPNGQIHVIAASLNATLAGDAAAKQGDWTTAVKDYQQAVQYWPENQLAHYALGDHDASIGAIADAVTEYRAAIYTHPKLPRLPRINEPNVERLMKYALLLYQTGQTAEALNVYADGAQKLNYDGDEPARRVMLPTFGPGAAQLPLTAQNFQGMAHLAIGIDTLDHQGYATSEAFNNLQQAVELAPRSADAHYYLGEYLFGKNDPGAKAEFQKAADLGDDPTAAAAKDMLKVVH